jgi:hypothetical protein
MPADIAHSGGAEQSVAKGVQKHIGVRMSVQALLVWNVHAADDELAPRDQGVNVESLPYSQVCLPWLARIISANCRSSA